MLNTKVTEIEPYTEAERDRDRQARRDTDARLYARKKARRSGQHYDAQSTPAIRHATNRMVGSK